MFDGVHHAVAHADLAALQPAAHAETDADVGAVGNLHRLLVALEVAEHTARNAAQGVDRRIVGVDADTHASLLGHRRNLADHVGVVVPQFFFAVDAPVGQLALVDLAGPVPHGIVDVERARVHAAAPFGPPGRPDAVGHVRVGVVLDARRADVADKLLELLHLFIATGQVERDLRHVVDAEVGDAVDLDAVVAKALDQTLVKVERVLLWACGCPPWPTRRRAAGRTADLRRWRRRRSGWRSGCLPCSNSSRARRAWESG